MDLDKIGLREKKKAKQKVDLLLEFINQMLEKQVYEIKISDVCKEAFVSDMVFYNYFEKKENAVFTLLELWYIEFFYYYENTEAQTWDERWKLYADYQLETQSISPNFTIGIYTTLLRIPNRPPLNFTSPLERYMFFQEFRFLKSNSKPLTGIENVDLETHQHFFENVIRGYIQENNIDTQFTAEEIKAWSGIQQWGVGTYCSFTENFNDAKKYYSNMLNIFFKK